MIGFPAFLDPLTRNGIPNETINPAPMVIDIQMLLEKVLLYPNGHNN